MLWLLEWVVVMGYFPDTAHREPWAQFEIATFMPSLGATIDNKSWSDPDYGEILSLDVYGL